MNNPIIDKSFSFAVEIIKYCELLESNKKFVIAKQLLRSGTSIGANVREAQSSESKMDFIHKLKIASKEIEETEYWLLLCQKCEYSDCSSLLIDINELKKIISKIIITTKNNIAQK